MFPNAGVSLDYFLAHQLGTVTDWFDQRRQCAQVIKCLQRSSRRTTIVTAHNDRHRPTTIVTSHNERHDSQRSSEEREKAAYYAALGACARKLRLLAKGREGKKGGEGKHEAASPKLSAYERFRAENMASNQRMLQQLGL